MKSFDIDAFKAKWRALAAERGIDAQEGTTAFQVVDVRADERKRTHYERARAAVYADAEKPKADLRYHDGYDAERAARRDWWACSEIWTGGGRTITIRRPVVEDQENLVSRIPPPDYQAVWNIRMEARRLEGRGIEITRREDKSALWREAWQEDGEARKRQTAALVKFAPLRQLAFA